jgi:hypothetical protein
VCGSLAVLLLEEPVVSRLLGLNRRHAVPGVQDSDNCNSHEDNNLDLIQCDLWTSPIVSISGYKYYLVILDDHSYFV